MTRRLIIRSIRPTDARSDQMTDRASEIAPHAPAAPSGAFDGNSMDYQLGFCTGR